MILFIDDEGRRMDSYVEELRQSGYKVILKSDVDNAVQFFQENYMHIKIVVLDIMMPPGTEFKNSDTKYGLLTGFLVYEKIRKITSKLPIIFFTNFSNTEMNQKILTQHKFTKDCNTLFLQKEKYLPFEFENEIYKLLRFPQKNSSISLDENCL